MPSNHFILCRPLLLPLSIFPSISDFSNESVLHIRWPKYWSCSFSISPYNEYSGLISFRIDWLDLLEVQGTLKSLLQHHSSKASILQHSAFFIVQLSHPYLTTGKTIALTIQTFVSKIVSLLLNMLSRFVLAFLPGSKASFNFIAAVTICSDFRAQEYSRYSISSRYSTNISWIIDLYRASFKSLVSGFVQSPWNILEWKEEYSFSSGSQHHLISLSLSFLIRKLRMRFHHVSLSQCSKEIMYMNVFPN